MFNLIKTELSYYKTILIVLSTILITLHVIFLVYGAENIENSVPALKTAIFAFTIILFVYRTITFIKDGRDIIFNSLPLKPESIGLARLSFLPIFWFFAMILFLISNLIVQLNDIGIEFIYDIISLSGALLLINALVMIYIDFLNFGLSRKKTLIIQISGIFLAAFTYLMFLVFMPMAESFDLTVIQLLRNNLSNLYNTFVGSFILLTLATGLTILSVNIFSKRKSYLN